MALMNCNAVTDSNKKELSVHGETAFPIACYYDDLQAESVPWHWHDELEAGFITEGEAVVAIDSERITLKKGQGFFINSGVLHALWCENSSDCHLQSIVFHPRLVGGSPESIYWNRYVHPVITNPSIHLLALSSKNKWQQEIIHQIAIAWESCDLELPGYEFATRDALSKIIFWLYSSCPHYSQSLSEKEKRDGERIKQMLQFIHDNYKEEINTSQIAANVMISPSECLRCFHNTISTTPIQYLKQYRIQQAVNLLSSTNMKIAEIGAECGFQEMSYFAKAFRELKGCTPSEYRNV